MSASRPCFGGEVSLRNLLKRAVFVGADDIMAARCVGRADQVRPGDVFVPQSFSGRDEHEAIADAVTRGATAVVSERLLLWRFLNAWWKTIALLWLDLSSSSWIAFAAHVDHRRGGDTQQDDYLFILVRYAQRHWRERRLLHVAGFERFGNVRSFNDSTNTPPASWPTGCRKLIAPARRPW